MFTIHVHVYVPKTCPRKHDLKKKKKIMLSHAWIQITHRSLEWCCFKKLHLNQLKCNFSTFCTPCTDDTYVKPELPPLENGSPNKEGIPASLPPIGKTKRYGGCICNIVYSWSICKPLKLKKWRKKISTYYLQFPSTWVWFLSMVGWGWKGGVVVNI